MSRINHTLIATSKRQPKGSLANLSLCHLKRREVMLKLNTLFIGLFAVIALLVLAPGAGLAQNLNSPGNSEKKLTAADLTNAQFFGVAVAISGDTAVVGAPDGIPSNQAAYVYTRVGSDWIQQAKLTPSDYVEHMSFGCSVAIDGDTIVVGAEGFKSNTSEAFVPGSAYVFVRSGSTWTEQKKFSQPVQEGRTTGFGASVALNGDTLAISEIYTNDIDNPVYVYVRSNSIWTLQQTLHSPTAGAEGSRLLFGFSLAIEGNTLVAGTPEEDDEDAHFVDSGSVFVFLRSGSTWSLQQKLTASDARSFEFFGNSVSLDGDQLAVGSPNTISQVRTGTAYIFSRSGSTWTEQQKVHASDFAAQNAFGHAVAIKGGRLIVSAPASSVQQDNVNLLDSVYIFTRSNSTWIEQQHLIPSDSVAGDFFGRSVALSLNNIIVGASSNSTQGAWLAGAAYVYSNPQGDTTAPIISGLNNLSITAISTSGATATFNPTATDDVDGSVPVTCSPTSGSIFPIGVSTVTCQATDSAGNTATGSFAVTVTYAWSGFLQPINQDGSSVFKLGSTIAVKFQLAGASSGVQNATAKFSYVKISNLVAGTATKTSTTAAPSTGDMFRFDGTSQYIYNWGTKGLTAGTYQLRIDLSDGVSRTVNVSLK